MDNFNNYMKWLLHAMITAKIKGANSSVLLIHLENHLKVVNTFSCCQQFLVMIWNLTRYKRQNQENILLQHSKAVWNEKAIQLKESSKSCFILQKNECHVH